MTERTTRDRRFADTVVMPAAITEVGNIAATSMPSRFDTGCRDDLVAVDGAAVPVRVSGSVDGGVRRRRPRRHDVLGTGDAAGRDGRRRPDRRAAAAGCRSTASSSPATTPLTGATRRGDGPRATVIDSDRLSRTITVERLPRRLLVDRRRGTPPVMGGDDGRRLARAVAARRRRVQRLVDPTA